MKKSMLLAWMSIFILMPFFAFSQTRQVTGTVSDEQGVPLPLVSITQKGTSNGTTTDKKGSFTITVTGANPCLLFLTQVCNRRKLQ